jgi:hypothetical protein
MATRLVLRIDFDTGRRLGPSFSPTLLTTRWRCAALAGLGSAAKFQPANEEIRFSFRFEVLDHVASGKVIQRGICTLQDGRRLSLTMNDEEGALTPEGDVRVYAGLRSDPFYLAWIAASLRRSRTCYSMITYFAWWSSSTRTVC